MASIRCWPHPAPGRLCTRLGLDSPRCPQQRPVPSTHTPRMHTYTQDTHARNSSLHPTPRAAGSTPAAHSQRRIRTNVSQPSASPPAQPTVHSRFTRTWTLLANPTRSLYPSSTVYRDRRAMVPSRMRVNEGCMRPVATRTDRPSSRHTDLPSGNRRSRKEMCSTGPASDNLKVIHGKDAAEVPSRREH